ncbi:major egg antigen-like [Anneissia japonica]|uniref:major egg antigen-like n=1 Tax=Anneissia japonica TaxID=1529436 RepID=UPI0014258B31|nr:major egg antigen-like [Anneissia japonica]
MFSLSSPSFFVHQPVCRRRRREPAFDPWTSCLGDGPFIFGNAGRRPEPTYFLIDPFDVNDLKTSSKRQKTSPKTSETCRQRDNFHVELDLTDFKPEEIDVSLDSDRLKIHAKSEDKHGISSEVFKWYSLPDKIDTDKLTSSLSQEGALHINAPFKVVKQDKDSIANGGVGSSQKDEQMDKTNQQEVEIEKEDSTQPISTGVTIEQEEANDTSAIIGHSEKDNGFHVELPMEQFKPEHVNVSIDDHKLKIHAKKVDEGEGHFMHEEVTKWFSLPSDVDVGQLRSNIRDDGVLVINAPKANNAVTLETESVVKEDETAQEMSIDDKATNHAQEEESN